MKSRPLTYTLLLVALGVWGVVIWKIFFAKTESPILESPTSSANVSSLQKCDTLRLDYPDPFLRTISSKPTIQHRRVVHERPRSQTVSPEPPVVQLGCAGRIWKQGETYYLVSIDGHGYVLRVWETVQGYRLQHVVSDSLVLVRDPYTFRVKVP